MALEVGLRYEQRIAGIIALSTYLHDAAMTEQERTDANLALPIFMGHGTADPRSRSCAPRPLGKTSSASRTTLNGMTTPWATKSASKKSKTLLASFADAFDAQNRFSTRMAGGSACVV